MRLAAPLALALILGVACSPTPSDPAAPPPPRAADVAPSPLPAGLKTVDVPTHIDLAERLPVAQIRGELRSLPFDHADGQEVLAAGWTPYRQWHDGGGFRWIGGSAAVLEVPRLSREDAQIALTVEPPPETRGRPRQSLVATFNGEPLGAYTLDWRRQTLTLDLPASAQRIGVNRLVLSPRWWVDALIEPESSARQPQDLFVDEGFEGPEWAADQLTAEAPREGQRALRLVADGTASVKVVTRARLPVRAKELRGLHATVWSHARRIDQGFSSVRVFFYGEDDTRRLGEDMIVAIPRVEAGWTRHAFMVPAKNIPADAVSVEIAFQLEAEAKPPSGVIDFDSVSLIAEVTAPDDLYAQGYKPRFAARLSGVEVSGGAVQRFTEPRAQAEGDAIVQRAGTLMSYALEIPPAGRLTGALSLDPAFTGLPPGATGRVSIHTLTEAGEDAEVLSAGFDELSTTAPRPVDVDLAAHGGRLLGLTLAVSVTGAGADAPCAGCAARWQGLAIDGRAPRLEADPALRRAPHNVLLILDDTLRADVLGAYGGEVEAPALAALGAGGATFLGARSESSFTSASVTSLLSATHAGTHRVLGRDRLPEGLPWLPEALQRAGYATLGVSFNSNISLKAGFSRGFSSFHEAFRRGLSDALSPQKLTPRERADALWERVLEPFFDGRGDAPFFAYLHDIDPHSPYKPPPPYDRLFDFGYQGAVSGHDAIFPLIHGGQMALDPADVRYLRSQYMGEVAYMDAFFGALLDRLRAEGLLDDTLVVFVSDHGEELMEHGRLGHNKSLYEEVLRVPMILSLPGVVPAGRRPVAAVQLSDVAPTLLDLAGLPRPEGMEGESLLPLLTAPDTYRPLRTTLSAMASPWDRWTAAARGDYKLVVTTRDRGLAQGDRHLYDLAHDPEEQVDVWAREVVIGEALSQALAWEALKAARGGAGPDTLDDADLDPETREHLKELGYVQ